ncbi:BPSS1780 family membrane protein [Castellaniella sp.]|uniref:BPSS1780 family membrane protein n=1 Tax=Castellaniella sp. TaxID=1955812 RepID=UPI003569AA79
MKPLQAAILPTRAGWFWIQQGYALFRRQPVAMLFWSVLTSLFINAGALFPVIGQAILVTLTPTLTYLTLCAGKHLANDRRILPGMWFLPLKTPGVLRGLLRLGWAWLVCSFVAAFVALLPFMDTLVDLIDLQETPDLQALAQAMWAPLMLFGLIYLFLSALFWHAPALVGWHALPLRRALFYSMVACWRNKGAILLYIVTWVAAYLGLHEFIGLLAASGMSDSTLAWVILPLDILITALLYCSFYPIYRSIFESNQGASIRDQASAS